MLIALVILSWPGTSRLVRGQVMQQRGEGYIQAAQLLGAKSGYLIIRHMIPNTMGVILVSLTFAVPTCIFTEAFLSFIGMGVAPPTPARCFRPAGSGIRRPTTRPAKTMASARRPI